MTYPPNIHGEHERLWDLANGEFPLDCREADLIATAAVISPFAWKHDQSVWARFRSLDSATRVVRWIDVCRPVAVERPKAFSLPHRLAALFRALPVHRRARAS